MPHIAHPGEIETLWDSFEPFIQRSVDHSPAGMLTTEAIREMLEQDHAAALYTTRGEEIMMVLVVRKVYYATYASARVLACAGRDLVEAYKFIDVLTAWCFTIGAVEIEAWCRPALVRFHRRAGFKVKTTIVTLDLRGKLQ